MDPLSFVLTVAANVLSTVISKLAEGSVETVLSHDIKQLVFIRVRQGPNSQIVINDSNLGAIANSVLGEVYEIAGRDEVLQIEHGDLKLQPGISIPSDMIAFQIAHLREIVEIRRRELSLHGSHTLDDTDVSDSDNNVTISSDNDRSTRTGSYEWVERDQEITSSPWDTAIRDMHQRIRDRRLGGSR